MVKRQWILDEEDYVAYENVLRQNEQVRGFNENLTREIQSMRQTIGDLMKERDILNSELSGWRKDKVSSKIIAKNKKDTSEGERLASEFMDKYPSDEVLRKKELYVLPPNSDTAIPILNKEKPKKESLWDALFNGSIIGMAWNLSKKKKK